MATLCRGLDDTASKSGPNYHRMPPHVSIPTFNYVYTVCMCIHYVKKLLFCHLIRRTWRPTAGRELGQWGRSTQAHISMPVSLAAVVSCLGWPLARVPGMTRRGGLFCPYLAGAARNSRWRQFCQNWVAITALTLIFRCLRSNMPSLFACFRATVCIS
ncbi:hypothetical protein N656DRAFT_594942 [Canariomyces notabilis]|uniref:Uncharacterized protein n=1 Tax=Canariomyces notabilis TaxID=2074819 RepID=A0AAN6TGF9_9PEZI|nr:hypothetical protein N656DRAFT_594942 [Canariomyces arenarius]